MNSFKSGIASVPRQAPVADKKTLDPRATRYGLVPIWPQKVSARDFYVWTIQPNNVFPFRPFIGEIGQDTKGNKTYVVERLPAEQVSDLQRHSKFFFELPAIALLNENDADLVAAVLANPKSCSKYAIELGNQCANCWMEYLHSDLLAERVRELSREDLVKAATESIPLLREGIKAALSEARRLVDVAVREVDDPRKGKSDFSDYDFLNIYHTHADRPKYKTSTSNTDSIQALADLLQANVAKPAVDQSALAAMIAQAVEAATAPLQAKLAEYENASKAEESVEDKAAKIKEKIEKAKS